MITRQWVGDIYQFKITFVLKYKLGTLTDIVHSLPLLSANKEENCIYN
jgi:hypothetical protein